MSTQAQAGLPSFRQLQTLIQGGSEVEVKVVTNDLLVGKNPLAGRILYFPH